MATKVGDAFVEIGARTDKLNRGLKQSRTMMGGLGSMALRVGGIIGGALAGRALARGIKSWVTEASNAEETFSKFGVVFQAVGVQAENAAEKMTKSFGLSSVHAKQLLGDTGDLLSGFGFAGKEALAMSTRVNELAVDLASFTNVEGGAARASRSLTKALLGERESVKELGIAILEKDVLARVALNNAKGMTFASLRQAKAEATLQLAIEQSKNAIGDYARTSDSLANRTKRLSERSQDLRVAIGQGIAEFANAKDIVEAVSKVVIKLTGKLNALGSVDWFEQQRMQFDLFYADVKRKTALISSTIKTSLVIPFIPLAGFKQIKDLNEKKLESEQEYQKRVKEIREAFNAAIAAKNLAAAKAEIAARLNNLKIKDKLAADESMKMVEFSKETTSALSADEEEKTEKVKEEQRKRSSVFQSFADIVKKAQEFAIAGGKKGEVEPVDVSLQRLKHSQIEQADFRDAFANLDPLFPEDTLPRYGLRPSQSDALLNNDQAGIAAIMKQILETNKKTEKNTADFAVVGA